MKKLTGGLFLPGLAVALAISLFKFEAQAVPYASGVTNNGAGTIYFILNEAADDVTVTRNVGGPVHLGPLAKGLHSFALGAATTYEIAVTKSATPTWTLISDDLNPLVRFFGPRGIAVNRNPSNLRLFGRIYVASTAAGTTTATPTASNRTTGDGIYVLNADTSDALGQGDTAATAGVGGVGVDWTLSANSPFKIEVGEDNQLYIGDFGNANGGILRTDPDVVTSELVLAGVGNTANPTVHTTINGSPIVKGSLAGGNLTVWAIDGQWASAPANFNRLLRWDISAGPLPYNAAPVELGTNSVPTVADVQSDLDIAPDGKFFVSQNRAAGTPNVYNPTQVNLRVYDTDGITMLFDSLATSLAIGSPTDILALSRAIKISPDGKTMAMIRNDTRTMIVALTNGIPDLSQTNLINTFAFISGSTSNGREIGFDVAGNLYAANTSTEVLRIWSPGGTTTAKTKSDGTFTIVVPPTTVTVAATDASANEAGPDNGTFTISRTGNTASALTVNYTLAGTAGNGSDYATLPTWVTLAPGAASTNITVATSNDGEAESTETVILNLDTGANYGIGVPASATVSILDNETPELSITAIKSRLLECFAGGKATLTVTRKGLLTSALTANLAYTPASGTDFNGPATVSIPSGIVSSNINITPVDDSFLEGNETVTVFIDTGMGYNVGTPGSANVTLIDDEAVPGTTLFADNFDVDSSGAWTVNAVDGDNEALFAYDYTADGIPSAPATLGGTKKGLRLRTNLSARLANGLSVSPNGQSFTGDYRLKFDMWLNYNGPLDVGGPGSTQNGSAGIGTTGDHAQVPGAGGEDGGWFSAANDGDIGTGTSAQRDYTAYTGASHVPEATGAYNAGTQILSRDTADPYYDVWGGVMAPAAQLLAYPGPNQPTNQTGITRVGCLGMAWHCVSITKIGETVNWSIDGLSIATITNDATTPFTTTGNIFLGCHDLFSSLATNTAVEFALFDNVKVETVIIQPVITSIKIVGPDVEIEFSAGVGDAPANFTLQSAGAVESTLTDIASTITSLGGGNFKAKRALSGTTQFYQIKRF